MKNILVSTALCLTTFQVAFAQNTPATGTDEPLLFGGEIKSKSGINFLKLYLGYDLAQRPVVDMASLDQSEVLYRQDYNTQPFYALAFAREASNGNFWEISGQTNAYFGSNTVIIFDTLPFSPFEERGKERNNYAQLQYEYNWLLAPNDNPKKVRPYIGLFLRSQTQWAKYTPTSSAIFPKAVWRTVMMPGFIPRVVVKDGKRLQVGLSAPICLGFYGLVGSVNENPELSREEQRSTSFDLSMLTLETQVRLGIAYRLNRPED